VTPARTRNAVYLLCENGCKNLFKFNIHKIHTQSVWAPVKENQWSNSLKDTIAQLSNSHLQVSLAYKSYTFLMITNRSLCSFVNSAVNMALPAFAAERRAAAPCYRSPAACDRAVSKLLLGHCNGTDRRTDTVPLHRPSSACYAASANKQQPVKRLLQRFLMPMIQDSNKIHRAQPSVSMLSVSYIPGNTVGPISSSIRKNKRTKNRTHVIKYTEAGKYEKFTAYIWFWLYW